MPFHRGAHSRVLHKEVSLKMRNRITVDEISASLNKKGARSDHKVEVRVQWENQIEFNPLHPHKGPINKVVAGKKRGDMREVLTLGTKLELIRSAERRWFTLPAVNCYTRSRSKPLVEPSSHYSSRQAFSSQTRNESNFRWLKNLNWWSWGWCAGPSLSLSLLIKTAPLWRKTVRERDSAALCQKRKKEKPFLPAHPHLHFKAER